MRFTRDVEFHVEPAGQTAGFLGRAHPLVLRAIRRGCQLNGTVAVAYGPHLGLLSTFEIEIAQAGPVVFRRIVAVMAMPDRPPAEIRDWLCLGTRECLAGTVWDRLFASWAEPARPATEALVHDIADRQHEMFAAAHEASSRDQASRSRHWLRTRANHLCGPFIPPTGDLFGEPASGPDWRSREDPLTRLISFATDTETPAAKRREANETIAALRTVEARYSALGPVTYRPLGMLMLVPADAL
jgi:hypothetical protein